MPCIHLNALLKKDERNKTSKTKGLRRLRVDVSESINVGAFLLANIMAIRMGFIPPTRKP